MAEPWWVCVATKEGGLTGGGALSWKLLSAPYAVPEQLSALARKYTFWPGEKGKVPITLKNGPVSGSCWLAVSIVYVPLAVPYWNETFTGAHVPVEVSVPFKVAPADVMPVAIPVLTVGASGVEMQ